jgi:lysophospholipase L1-like esterase
MIPVEVFIAVVVVLLLANYVTYKFGVKYAINNFMEQIFIAGLMGKVDAFRQYNKYCKPGQNVMVGDSITQDFNTSEYFPEHIVYNRGIGGDTSSGVLSRLDVSVYDLKPKKVFLNIGTNDFERLDDRIEGTFQRIQEICNKIKEFDSKIELYVISVYPVNPNVDKRTVGKRNNQEITELNSKLSKINGIYYLDLFSKLVKDGVLNPDYTIEGLHFNQNGYEILRTEVLKHL